MFNLRVITPGRLLVLVLLTLPASLLASEWQAQRLLEFTQASCSGWDAGAGPATGFSAESAVRTDIRFGEARIGTRYRIDVDNGAHVEFDVIERTGQPRRFIGSLYHQTGDPILLLALGPDCEMQVARRINYSDHGQALNVVSLDAELAPLGEPDWINPPLEFLDRNVATALKQSGDATPLRIGMVDSGVNYRLPEINRRLAKNGDGQLIGYDFWDMDGLPYDAHPVNTGFFLQRHGTRTASLLLREAPAIELVPYRYPRPDMSRMQALIEHADHNQVSILGMPLGGNRSEDWNSFERAARAHPHMLFVVSAGNDGRDIDQRPVYPAAIKLENIVVVTSADDFVRPAERTNWGRKSVDYLVPAERLLALDYSGVEVRVSGSSYAVSRVTALAARLKMAHPHWQAPDLVAELTRRYGETGATVLDWVSIGYIADPLAGAALRKLVLPDLAFNSARIKEGLSLPLDILIIDPRWSRQRVEQAVRQAFEILAQCEVVAGPVSIHAIDGEEYLGDLSTGNAHTLLTAAGGAHSTVVFARGTRMREEYLGEAFGIGNTRMRPWLTNSVWLMLDVDDAGIALAHELYHVIANSGAHVEGVPNLMQPRTRPESLDLTAQQCRLARDNGLTNQLLQN